MNRRIRAIFLKEVRSEMRTKSGLTTTVLFSLFTVVTISLATFDLQISPQLGAGLLCVALLFAAIVALPRTLIIEEEQGTGDLLRLVAKSEDAHYRTCFESAFPWLHPHWRGPPLALPGLPLWVLLFLLWRGNLMRSIGCPSFKSFGSGRCPFGPPPPSADVLSR